MADASGSAVWSYADAVREALGDAMRGDPAVVLLGEDVAHGGVFGLTRGLVEEFGADRVRNTPISEAAITGFAVGAALVGLRPVVEIMFMDFVTLALDMLVNQAAKLPALSGGQQRVPLVLRTQAGILNSAGAQHSQSLEAWLAHVPGLVVLAPSGPADAYAAVRWATAADEPVVVMEHKGLYTLREPRPTGSVEPLGAAPLTAAVRRPGRDVTVVAYSAMVRVALEAAGRMAGEGIEVEVVDPRCLAPLDEAGLLSSVRRTHRLVVLHEAPGPGGLGAEIAARMGDLAFDDLDAPIRRLAGAAVPMPFSPPLEAAAVPSPDSLCAMLREVVA